MFDHFNKGLLQNKEYPALNIALDFHRAFTWPGVTPRNGSDLERS